MTYRAVLTNGVAYIVDPTARTIELEHNDPAAVSGRMIARYAATLLESGQPIGPQVDDLLGVRGDWADDRAPLVAMVQAAQGSRLHVASYEPVR